MKKPETILDIHDDLLYEAEDTARVLDMCVDSVYKCGRRGTLRRTPWGPRGGGTRFLGSDIKAYYYRARKTA